MELQLDPVIPMIVRGKDGRPKFNRGYHSPMKGKTYDEIYGEERARELKRIRSEKLKGHKDYNVCKIHRIVPCVAIHQGRIVARFPSCAQAAKTIGVTRNQITRWIKGRNKPKNGWQWFYEAESWKWCDLLTNP